MRAKRRRLSSAQPATDRPRWEGDSPVRAKTREERAASTHRPLCAATPVDRRGEVIGGRRRHRVTGRFRGWLVERVCDGAAHAEVAREERTSRYQVARAFGDRVRARGARHERAPGVACPSMRPEHRRAQPAPRCGQGPGLGNHPDIRNYGVGSWHGDHRIDHRQRDRLDRAAGVNDFVDANELNRFRHSRRRRSIPAIRSPPRSASRNRSGSKRAAKRARCSV
jgi:hypothetical protein